MSLGNKSAVSIMDASKVDLHLSECCYKSFACAPFSITALQTKAALNNHQRNKPFYNCVLNCQAFDLE